MSKSPSFNIFKLFSSITTRPIEAKFHVEPPWNGGTKVSSTGLGHMTKMAAMPIYMYVKNLYTPSIIIPTVQLIGPL